MSFSDWALGLGGLGFLLLGMGMMSEGLKAAAGDSLRGILERSTKTRLRALLAGFTLTAVVQSSSAVIVTILGFTNAGMLGMRKAAWIVFGSNVGTTVTAWIVALIGLKVRIDMLALPIIGAAMLLNLLLPAGRWKHIGFALAGFGILFYGLGALRDAFDHVAEVLPVEQIRAAGGWGILIGVVAGMLLTLLIQSSAAALAIILTAAVTGVFTPLVGASLVIGANIGTTGTTVLASIGATANARRLAALHLTEKAFTATIALLLLWPMWLVADYISDHTGGSIATALAVYHTLFNVLSVALMAFFANRLFRFVERIIKQPDLSSEKPRYLDKTVLSSPSMGVAAMRSELKRVFKQLLRRGRGVLALNQHERDGEDALNTSVLLTRISEFSDALSKTGRMGQSADTFLNMNWAVRELLELRLNLNELRSHDEERISHALSSEMLRCMDQLLGSGQLKNLSDQQRGELMNSVREARINRRQALLVELEEGSSDSALVTGDLNIIAVCEDSAKHVLRIANILYPPTND